MKKTALGGLVLANLVPILGIVIGSWDVFSILFFYWLESVVVGLYNVAKMAMIRTVQGGVAIGPRHRISGIIFFAIHYSAFMAGHGLFIFVLFEPQNVEPAMIIVAALSLVVSHGISFVANFIGKKEYSRTTLSEQMIAPYKRVVVMHLSIILCGFLVNLLPSSQMLLIPLVLLKIAIDIAYHFNEHRTLGTYGSDRAGGRTDPEDGAGLRSSA